MNRKLIAGIPVCTTRFIYDQMRDPFRDFQKYLSVVGGKRE